jgi:hypothetical protein
VKTTVADPLVTAVVADDQPAIHKGKHSKSSNVEQTKLALVSDIERHRARLAVNVDELHTRLSPKYQAGQLKHTLTQAGTDAISILKSQGAPVDETRKKNAEIVMKAGGALGGLVGLHLLRKAAKRARLRRTVKHAVETATPDETIELVGVVEGVKL